MEFTGERFVPKVLDRQIKIEHYQRYHAVCALVENKIVLDAASGEGYGSFLLSHFAAKVIGIDISEESVMHAQSAYSANNLSYICGSVAKLPFPDYSIDIVISFETIEHIDEITQNQFLREIKRVLKPNGQLIISTPNKYNYSDKKSYVNPFHIKEFYKSEFTVFLSNYFNDIEMFEQKNVVTSMITNNRQVETFHKYEVESTNELVDGTYMIAVCSHEKNQHKSLSSIVILYDDYEQKVDRIIELQQEVEEKNLHIKLLEEENQKLLGNVQKQLLQKITLKDKLFPINSKRRLIAKLAMRTIKKPKTMLSKLNRNNIRKLNYYLKQEDISSVENRINHYLGSSDLGKNSTSLQLVGLKGHKERIIFPVYSKPLVSIIIPVYNQWDYTYSCLVSILEQTKDCEYEVIVADDMSTDDTRDVARYIENIKVVRDGTNKGFLLNCNNAAIYAEGEYIVFLNNDTNVQSGWLEHLVSTMEGDASIGLVGSKLLYPNGKLQEAGGIVWSNASGWNYGRLDDPSKPAYNYTKEVDYISGASIMVRKSLWDKIGGFDERYIPAYYEDTDLAFEVRKHGYKVCDRIEIDYPSDRPD